MNVLPHELRGKRCNGARRVLIEEWEVEREFK
jgi:hypothetical protein